MVSFTHRAERRLFAFEFRGSVTCRKYEKNLSFGSYFRLSWGRSIQMVPSAATAYVVRSTRNGCTRA
jgi:hypothetical protein